MRPLAEKVEKTSGGLSGLYGLVELVEDFDDNIGILRSRNVGTHRFVILHDLGNTAHIRQAPEIEHHSRDQFTQGILSALRVARSAVQMLAFSISQHEQGFAHQTSGLVGSLIVLNHDQIRERDKKIK